MCNVVLSLQCAAVCVFVNAIIPTNNQKNFPGHEFIRLTSEIFALLSFIPACNCY